MQTEKDFLQGLSLCMEVFIDPGAEKHPEVDTDLLLGNMEDIADVSQRLLTQLEAAIQGKEFDQQVIGMCFMTLADDMKNAYAPYCRNHDSVITLIEKYKEEPSISAFLQSQLDKLREKCVVFDLEAILIKPVQRILKYPLLLNELFKSTEDDHPDKPEILAGINAMTDVATAINEYKRRKDLVYKYKKETDASFGDKLAKLSFHTIKKKGSRFKGRLTTNLGFSPQTRDENFENEETRFRQLEKIVKIFVRDVQTFTTQIQDSVSYHENLVADIIDFYDDKQQSPTVQQFQQAQQKIDNTFLPEFLENVSVLVVSPLTKLTQMFDGPTKVIQKRYDKLLDYDNLLRKGKDEKATEKSLSKAKQDYEALNAQLLDELPKLYSLSLSLLQDCVTSFVRAQQEYANSLFLHMSDMLDLPSLLTHGENVVEMFNIQHVAMVDRLSMLSFIPKGFNPKVDAAVKSGDKKLSKRQSLINTDTPNPQLDSQRVFLRQRYSPDQLFRVAQTYTAIDMMDLSLQEGDLVGVVMKKDPMGNRERWFVDNATTKGFVPSHILQLPNSSPQQSHSQLYPSISQPDVPSSPIGVSPQNSNVTPSPIGQYSSATSSPQNTHQTSSPIGQTQKSPKIVPPIGEDELSEELDEMLNEDMTPDISSDYSRDSYIPECEEFYYAEYAFDARNSNEMTMFEGQVVTVLAKHDEEQNTDWWYVDADGHRGYAPAAYLKPMS
ncbi:hypothetical protein FSP39_011155 [Pinctada imbricata]|uniref:Dynamin-binding protein n=1 Tax=Pinctada imbricata TaxID=66713 RepID=A0AA89C647_PINIB|nr:hypothetical protein FSP39_011155 [Pinctada imbricata]